MRLLLAVSLLVATTLFAAGTQAQDVPPDVIVLHDGTFLRGVILERVPDSHVLVQLASGPRRIAMSEVAYAGGAADAPNPEDVVPSTSGSAASPSAAPSPAGESADPEEQETYELRLESNMPGTRVAVMDRAAFAYSGDISATARGYGRGCSTPCSARIPSGYNHFMATMPNGDSVEARSTTFVDGPGTLFAEIRDRRGIRIGVGIAGGLLFAAGVGAALVGISAGEGALITGVSLSGVGALMSVVVLQLPRYRLRFQLTVDP